MFQEQERSDAVAWPTRKWKPTLSARNFRVIMLRSALSPEVEEVRHSLGLTGTVLVKQQRGTFVGALASDLRAVRNFPCVTNVGLVKVSPLGEREAGDVQAIPPGKG